MTTTNLTRANFAGTIADNPIVLVYRLNYFDLKNPDRPAGG
jgi:hypothetical protein